MAVDCRICGTEIFPVGGAAQRRVTADICASCLAAASGMPDKRGLLESIDAPVLLMQGSPRQVVTANRSALTLFAKPLHEVESYRGGEVFDCVHAFTEAGCGKDVNCESCAIKAAIVDTFDTATPHDGVTSGLTLRKADGDKRCVLQVSTEKAGDLALVRIDRYDVDA